MFQLYVPPLDDAIADYQWLFWARDMVFKNPQGVCFSFILCVRISPGAVAFLGGLIRLAMKRDIPVTLDWDSLQHPAVLKFLRHNGFARSFGGGVHGWDSHCVPFREDPVERSNEVLDYLENKWIGRGWVQVSDRLKNAIVGHVWEIYANSFEHGRSDVGVFSCGHHFERKNELVLTVVDFGVGIATNVKEYLKSDPRSKDLLPSLCVEWAFKRGNSTGRQGIARGLGLDLLSALVSVNDGSLEIFTNSAHAMVSRSGVKFQELDNAFSGTVVQIKLKCDERLYHFRGEDLS